MSANKNYKLHKLLACGFLLTAVIFCCSEGGRAQDLEIKLKVSPPLKVSVEGKFINSKAARSEREISFLQNYADVSGLGARIENLRLFDEDGREIAFKKFAPGEFRAATAPSAFAYDVKIAAPDISAAAHVSQLAANQGLLMLGDLLPQSKMGAQVSAKVIFELPADWKIASGETQLSDDVFSVNNAEKAIFLVGQNWREKTARIGKTNFNFAISGEWQFSDDEAAEMAASILAEYQKTFGEIPSKQIQIFLLPVSQTVGADRWQAETRGATVTIISGALPSKREAIQRLHEQLRHEIFHLWLPNAVDLRGSYDWFYEGFTVYEALRIGVSLNQIRFQDYLNTLARAFDLAQNQNMSLLEMSNNRWRNANNSIYAKGMIVAFLCDLAILRESRGRRSITEIFQKVYRQYHDADSAADGNEAVIEILQTYPELQSIVRNYIEGAAKIEWREELNFFGIQSFADGNAARLEVQPNLSGRQKDLLDKLGYNQWRKLLRTKK